MLRQSFSVHLKVSSYTARRLATSSIEISKTHPELYNGILTNYGWVLVRKTHITKKWTHKEINKVLDLKVAGDSKLHDLLSVQRVVDDWMKNANLRDMPASRKKTPPKLQQESDMKLFLQQARYEDDTVGNVIKKPARFEEKAHKQISGDSVTFTNAWNYYVTMKYADYSYLPHKEARQKLGVAWRELSMDEKEHYRHEYANLLKSGKDIMAGKVVDREVKLKRARKLWEAKERKRLRDLGIVSSEDV